MTNEIYPIRRSLVCSVLWAIVNDTLPYDIALSLLNPGELRTLCNIFDIAAAEEAAGDAHLPQEPRVMRPPWGKIH